MEELELLVKLHLENERQGPGSQETTLKALAFTSLENSSSLKVADIGCGTGAPTITLASHLEGHITAIDLFPQFLDQLENRAKYQKLDHKITGKAVSMEELPFQENELDLIWSEGAIYNIGFEKGVKDWKKYLKDGGILAVSEITWLSYDRPQAINEYWQTNYPQIATASEKIKILEENSYKILGYFPLPESCWLENYYGPLQDRFDAFLETEGNSDIAQSIITREKEEIQLYENYKKYFSYGFYIAQKI